MQASVSMLFNMISYKITWISIIVNKASVGCR